MADPRWETKKERLKNRSTQLQKEGQEELAGLLVSLLDVWEKIESIVEQHPELLESKFRKAWLGNVWNFLEEDSLQLPNLLKGKVNLEDLIDVGNDVHTCSLFATAEYSVGVAGEPSLETNLGIDCFSFLIDLTKMVNKLQGNGREYSALLFMADYAEEYVECWSSIFGKELKLELKGVTAAAAKLAAVLAIVYHQFCIDPVGPAFDLIGTVVVNDFRKYTQMINDLLKRRVPPENTAGLDLILCLQQKVESDCRFLSSTVVLTGSDDLENKGKLEEVSDVSEGVREGKETYQIEPIGVAMGLLQEGLKELLTQVYTALTDVKYFKKQCTAFKKQLDSFSVLFKEIEDLGDPLKSDFVQAWFLDVETCLRQSKQLVASAGHAEKHYFLSKSKIGEEIQTKGAELEKLMAKGRDVQTRLIVQAADVKKIEEHLVELSLQTQQYMLCGGNKQGIVSKLTTIQSFKRMDYINKDNYPSPVVWQDQQEPIFGREEAINKLEELLLNPAGPKIIALHGCGGVGKSHVVQSLINRPTIQSCFGADSVFWISVGNDSSMPDLEQKVENNISKAKTGNGLIILDDIWKMDEATFVCRRSQNIDFRFIITTRVLKLIEALLPSIHRVLLEMLPETHSWNLFIYHAFPCYKETDIPTDLKDVAMSVAQECKGLPLALKVIGRAMSDKRTTAEWYDALQKLKGQKMIDGDHEKLLLQVLRVSYDALETMEAHVGKLRECFLYFGAFYEDENISVADLMNCWLGEGLMLKGKNPVQQTYIILGMLIGYSLIERSGEGTCKIHDVLRDLTFYISRKERPDKDLFQAYYKSCVRLDSTQLNQLSYERISWRFCSELSLVEIKAPHLKVLLLDQSSVSQEFLDAALPNLSSLQVLSLSRTHHITHLPDCLEKLQCLLVLNLCYSEIKNLPPSVGELKELKILDLRGCRKLAKLPTGEISGLQKLQVLKLSSSCVREEGLSKYRNRKRFTCPSEACLSEEDLSKYRNLTRLTWFSFQSTTQQLPVYLESMIELIILEMNCPIMNLDHLRSLSKLEVLNIINSNVESLPDWIADFSNLIKLAISTEKGKYVPDLDRLGRLRSLCLAGWSLLASMPKLPPCLENLHMTSCESLEVEDGLMHGHLRKLKISDCYKLSLKCVAHLPNLKKLKISGGVRSLPEAKVIPQVESITLSFEGSQKTEIPLSWVLPNSLCNLTHLKIRCGLCVELPKMICKEALPKLQRLSLSNVTELPGLEEGAFSNLRRLACGFKKGCTKFPDSLWRFLNVLPLLDSLLLNGEDVSLDEWGSSSVPKYLWLRGLKVKRLPSEMCAYGSPFHSLENLYLLSMGELEELPDAKTLAFPHLRKITLYDCPNVRTIPNCYKMQKRASKTHVTYYKC